MDNKQTTPYVIVIIVCFIVGLFLLYQKAQPAYDLYKEVQGKIQSVEQAKKEIEDLKAQKAKYEQEERVSTKPVYKSDLAVTDPMSSYGVMFEDVIQSAKYNGLKLRSISYNTNPASDIVYKNIATEYNVCEVSMQLIGNYMQFRSYFQDLYNYPYLINLDKISIKPYEQNKRILIADVTVNLYSVKNEAQKAAAKAIADAAALQSGANEATEEVAPEVPMPGM